MAPRPQIHDIVTFHEAIAAGVPVTRLRGPSYRRLHHGVYAPANQEIDDDAAAHAWMRAMPESAAMYGPTAASWYGIPVVQPAEFHIIVPPGVVPRRRAGLVPHEGLGPHDAIIHRGLKVTTPERTWLDLSLTMHDVELVVAGDALVHRGLTTPERLIEAADDARRRRRVVRARKLARQVRAGVDSPPETRLRMILDDPDLVVNPDIVVAGGWIGRPDLADLELKVAIQYEGDIHRHNKRRWRADIDRDEIMREHGWEVVRVTADDLKYPDRLRARVRAAKERQRRRAAANLI